MNLPLIKAILILPGTVLVYVPALIVWATRNSTLAASFPPMSGIAWIGALIFGVGGLILMAWTVRLFTEKGGGGTPAPWEPVKNLIVVGPYRYVRNPMIIGVCLFLVAMSILLVSLPLFIWMVIFVAINNVYFALSEEPGLEARFGQSYIDYKANVHRWIPRLSPYQPEPGAQS